MSPSYHAALLDMCENLYAAGPGAVSAPYYAYQHSAKVVATDACPTGSSSITGLAFYPVVGLALGVVAAAAAWLLSSGAVGVLVVGPCFPSEAMIAGATPGRGAIGTSAME